MVSSIGPNGVPWTRHSIMSSAPMPSPNILRDNIARVCERIEAAAARAGRNPSEITLIGVSKTHPAEIGNSVP